MERKIRRLPEELTLTIAAGEVIERPASILKELLENAVDAGATAIRIELSKGGCGAIRIEDNGSGIPADEAPLAFERFATSKIDTFEDLYSVSSFGFRGEALPSIAAIARVELTTRTKKDLSGTRVVIQAGRIAEVTSVGCPVGTSIAVTQIFENVPVRKKFLKSEATEQGYCLDTLHCAALACPQVRIEARANGRALFSIPATTRQEERVTLVLGQETGNSSSPFPGREKTASGCRASSLDRLEPFQCPSPLLLRQQASCQRPPHQPRPDDGLSQYLGGQALSGCRPTYRLSARFCGRQLPSGQDGGPFPEPP